MIECGKQHSIPRLSLRQWLRPKPAGEILVSMPNKLMWPRAHWTAKGREVPIIALKKALKLPRVDLVLVHCSRCTKTSALSGCIRSSGLLRGLGHYKSESGKTSSIAIQCNQQAAAWVGNIRTAF